MFARVPAERHRCSFRESVMNRESAGNAETFAIYFRRSRLSTVLRDEAGEEVSIDRRGQRGEDAEVRTERSRGRGEASHRAQLTLLLHYGHRPPCVPSPSRGGTG